MRSQHPGLARPPKWCLGALATVSWPWVPAWGSLEPPRQDGENAQKMGKNGEKMGEIRPKTCKGAGITWWRDLRGRAPAQASVRRGPQPGAILFRHSASALIAACPRGNSCRVADEEEDRVCEGVKTDLRRAPVAMYGAVYHPVARRHHSRGVGPRLPLVTGAQVDQRSTRHRNR